MNQISTLLTPQESKVADLVAKGLSNREVGVQLNITEKTVKFHLTKVYKKLGVTRYQLINPLNQIATPAQVVPETVAQA